MMGTGVPPLLSPSQNTTTAVPLLASDTASPPVKGTTPVWGIYSNGYAVLLPDSMAAFEYAVDWDLPRYPMEEGAFQSYNKIAQPYDVRVQMTKGGSSADHTAFLASIAAISGSLVLFDLVTPDVTYVNANPRHYDYKRSATNGVGLLTVNMYFTEIRNTIQPAFANVAVPSAAMQVKTQTQPGAAQSSPTVQ